MQAKKTRVRIYEKLNRTEKTLVIDQVVEEPAARVVMLPSNYKRPDTMKATVLEILIGDDPEETADE